MSFCRVTGSINGAPLTLHTTTLTEQTMRPRRRIRLSPQHKGRGLRKLDTPWRTAGDAVSCRSRSRASCSSTTTSAPLVFSPAQSWSPCQAAATRSRELSLRGPRRSCRATQIRAENGHKADAFLSLRPDRADLSPSLECRDRSRTADSDTSSACSSMCTEPRLSARGVTTATGGSRSDMLVEGDAKVRIRLVVSIGCKQVPAGEDIYSHNEIFVALKQVGDERRGDDLCC
eukprot:762708-Hanusia_phi.AAC.7